MPPKYGTYHPAIPASIAELDLALPDAVVAEAEAASREIARFDAERRFIVAYRAVADHKGCDCGEILRGIKRPPECKLFGTVCTPETPTGACMVSSEGACAAHWTYGRFRTRQTDADLRRSA